MPSVAQQQAALAYMGKTSPLSTAFLLHVALEIPFAVQGLFSSRNLPFVDATNTTLVMVKMYASLSLASCVAAVMMYTLPEYLPGKRAFAVCLLIYHTATASVLLRAPRFIPTTFGAVMESLRLTPEACWGLGHVLLGVSFAVWWQGTLVYAQAARAATLNAQGGGGKRK